MLAVCGRNPKILVFEKISPTYQTTLCSPSSRGALDRQVRHPEMLVNSASRFVGYSEMHFSSASECVFAAPIQSHQLASVYLCQFAGVALYSSANWCLQNLICVPDGGIRTIPALVCSLKPFPAMIFVFVRRCESTRWSAELTSTGLLRISFIESSPLIDHRHLRWLCASTDSSRRSAVSNGRNREHPG